MSLHVRQFKRRTVEWEASFEVRGCAGLGWWSRHPGRERGSLSKSLVPRDSGVCLKKSSDIQLFNPALSMKVWGEAASPY